MDELKIPKCMADLKDKKAQKGGKCFFQIKIRGDPLPEIKWFFNDNEIGKKHALKKYDQFTLNTSCFWRSVKCSSCAISRNFCYNVCEIAQLCSM